MGIFGLGHRHISPETLAEYLDGRLRSQTRERLDKVMAGCADCRLEMESLRDTIAMLRQLPVTPPRRSFIMSAPPQAAPQTVRQARLISPFRVPQWAYAGAASLAALALAVLVSVDASGLVAPVPDTIHSRPGSTALTTAETGADEQGSPLATAGVQVQTAPQPAGDLEIQIGRETAAEAPASAELQAQAPAAAETRAQAPAVAEMQAQAPAVAETQAVARQAAELQAAAPAVAEVQAQAPQAAVTDVKTPTEKSLEAPSVQLRMTEEPVVKSVLREQAAQPAAAETAPVQLEQASDAQPETVEVLPVPTVDSDGAAPEPAQVQETRIIAADEFKPLVTQRTPLIWRLLEGAVAALFLALVAVFYLRRRAARRF